MEAEKQRSRRKKMTTAAIFLIVNLLAVLMIGKREAVSIEAGMSSYVQDTKNQFGAIMDQYERSFRLFVEMMTREIENNPDPDEILAYLKSIDSELLEIEGDTFDGLYMYYQDRYLYSWSTPYSVYEDSGYVATERPWYRDAAAGGGEIVFTPPYMSYANHYILTTISQLQPDGKTVFAYDIKMGDIQKLVSSMEHYKNEQLMIYDSSGTLIGSTKADYLGGNLYASEEELQKAVSEAEAELKAVEGGTEEEISKAGDKVNSAQAFLDFQKSTEGGLERLLSCGNRVDTVRIDGKLHFAYHLRGKDYHFLVMAPVWSVLEATVNVWLVPLLLLELLLIYVLSRVSKEMRNRELRAAYVELGQTQKRLEIALSAAQKAAAVDDLTGMMNYKSFRNGMAAVLEEMEPDESGILLMLDGDHFKQVNDNYGHNVGDEVIKLAAQMIVGRIRTVDLASRLHGDEFAIFVANTSDYTVAKHIIEDINSTLEKEAKRRKMPVITLSAGAVIARHGDNFSELSKKADEVLYRAKESHNGGFAC